MCDAGVMAKHNPVPLGRWLRPRVEDERRTVPTSREEREGFFRFWSGLSLLKMEVALCHALSARSAPAHSGYSPAPQERTARLSAAQSRSSTEHASEPFSEPFAEPFSFGVG